MSQASKEIMEIDSTIADTNKKKIAAAASFKKLQPEEFYRHHIEKVYWEIKYSWVSNKRAPRLLYLGLSQSRK